VSKVVNEVVAANQGYVREFGKKGELPLPPARQFAILTCMDARLDPAKYAGLAEGDAHVIRNAGGRATDDAIRSLIISHKLLGTREWFVIHHTNCGMELFTDEVIADLLEDDLATASFDGKTWSTPHHTGGHAAGHFIKWAHDQEPGVERCARRTAHSGAPAGSRGCADLRVHLRRTNRASQRGEKRHRSWQVESSPAGEMMWRFETEIDSREESTRTQFKGRFLTTR
jgi:carbonic anhydrase